MMVINRKVERYAREVSSFLPSRDRAEAEHEITEMLLDLVRDHAGGKEPDILDARAVIDELGDPEIMAMSWLEAREDSGLNEEQSGFRIGGTVLNTSPLMLARMNKAVSVMLMVFTVLAVLFVGLGIVALGTHTINTFLPIFLGCVLGLVSIAGRSVITRQIS